MICSAVYHFADSMSISMLQAFFAGMQEPFSWLLTQFTGFLSDSETRCHRYCLAVFGQ